MFVMITMIKKKSHKNIFSHLKFFYHILQSQARTGSSEEGDEKKVHLKIYVFYTSEA